MSHYKKIKLPEMKQLSLDLRTLSRHDFFTNFVFNQTDFAAGMNNFLQLMKMKRWKETELNDTFRDQRIKNLYENYRKLTHLGSDEILLPLQWILQNNTLNKNDEVIQFLKQQFDSIAAEKKPGVISFLVPWLIGWMKDSSKRAGSYFESIFPAIAISAPEVKIQFLQRGFFSWITSIFSNNYSQVLKSLTSDQIVELASDGNASVQLLERLLATPKFYQVTRVNFCKELKKGEDWAKIIISLIPSMDDSKYAFALKLMEQYKQKYLTFEDQQKFVKSYEDYLQSKTSEISKKLSVLPSEDFNFAESAGNNNSHSFSQLNNENPDFQAQVPTISTQLVNQSSVSEVHSQANERSDVQEIYTQDSTLSEKLFDNQASITESTSNNLISLPQEKNEEHIDDPKQVPNISTDLVNSSKVSKVRSQGSESSDVLEADIQDSTLNVHLTRESTFRMDDLTSPGSDTKDLRAAAIQLPAKGSVTSKAPNSFLRTPSFYIETDNDQSRSNTDEELREEFDNELDKGSGRDSREEFREEFREEIREEISLCELAFPDKILELHTPENDLDLSDIEKINDSCISTTSIFEIKHHMSQILDGLLTDYASQEIQKTTSGCLSQSMNVNLKENSIDITLPYYVIENRKFMPILNSKSILGLLDSKQEEQLEKLQSNNSLDKSLSFTGVAYTENKASFANVLANSLDISLPAVQHNPLIQCASPDCEVKVQNNSLDMSI